MAARFSLYQIITKDNTKAIGPITNPINIEPASSLLDLRAVCCRVVSGHSERRLEQAAVRIIVVRRNTRLGSECILYIIYGKGYIG